MVGNIYMKIAICDDKKLYRNTLSKLVTQFMQQQHIPSIIDSFRPQELYSLVFEESFGDYKMSRPNVQKILYKNVQLVCLS